MDPELLFRVWIQQKMKKQINRKFIFNITPVNSVLCVLYVWTMKRTDSKYSRFFFLVEFKGFLPMMLK